MAERISVVRIDDIDGTEGAETIYFGLDRAEYEIDLTAENADKLREALAPYVGHARRAGGRRRSGGAGRSSGARGNGGASAADIRAWARENGYEVPDRGRVSAEVREAYAAAH